MTDPAKDSKNNETLDASIVEARRLLGEIKRARAQVDDNLTAAEAARKNAESEGLFAFNAKKACEEHSTAIAGLKGVAEADVNSILANRQKSDEFMAASNTIEASIDADKEAIADARKEVDRSALEILKTKESSAAHLREISTSSESAEASGEGREDRIRVHITSS